MDKNVMDRFLAHGVKSGASDLHFLVGDRPSYRIDGTLRPVKYERLSPADTQRICQNLVGDSYGGALEELQEHDCSYSVEGVARFRVNVYRQRGSLCCVLRVIPTKVPELGDLGLPERVRDLAEEERGLVLVTGATGSGKSSTLAAMIHHINQSRSAHILTIEDPIEFLHRNAKCSISQREVGPDTKSFTTALRSSLRQDPDVILVGEMRDHETIDIALKAAETGHMVFSTVHTTDAAKTISRLVSTFPKEEQQTVRLRLADCLRGVVSQRLLARADGRGRVLAVELMAVTKTVQEYIKDADKTSQLKDVIERGRDQYGMQSFDQHLTELYRAGTITMEVAMAAASNPSDFERALNFDASADAAAPGSDPDLSRATFDLEAGEASEEKSSSEESLFGDIDDGLGTAIGADDILELVER